MPSDLAFAGALWQAKDPWSLQMDRKDSDKPVRMHMMICLFAGRTYKSVGNAVLRLIFVSFLWFHIVCSCVRPPVLRPSAFSFPNDNLNKCQWIFTRLGMCIDIVEIWCGIASGLITSIFNELSARYTSVFSFPDDNLSKYQWTFTKLGMCIDIMEI